MISHILIIRLLNNKPKGSLKNTLKGGDLYAMELLILSKENLFQLIKPDSSKNTLEGGNLYAMELLIFSKEKCNSTY